MAQIHLDSAKNEELGGLTPHWPEAHDLTNVPRNFPSRKEAQTPPLSAAAFSSSRRHHELDRRARSARHQLRVAADACGRRQLRGGATLVLRLPQPAPGKRRGYDSTQDFRRGGPAGGPAAGFPVHYNYFPSVNSTYCAKGDALCIACQRTAFAYDDHNPSTYCTGSDRCVCVKACEAPSWRNDTLERLRNLTELAANASCPIAANVSTTFIISDNSSSSGSNDLSPVLTNVAVRKNVYANEDECRWYQNHTFCDTPRSCFDCLNLALYSGQRCTINPLGFCAPMAEYNYTYDYRVRPSPSAPHYFPSTNATYCAPSDAMCSRCRATAFQESASGVVNPTQFCVGASGCVCVAVCESPNWKSLVKNATCAVSGTTVASKYPFSMGTLALMMMGLTFFFTVSVQFLSVMRHRRYVRRVEERRQRHLQLQRERSVLGGQQLQLEGWKSLCQDLISKERERDGDGRPQGPILSHSEGPTVIVEEGDGYRPLPRGTSVSMNSSSSNSGSSESEVAVVLRSSCAWKEVVDANGACSLEPRSCRECLDGATTSSKECVLTPTGLCKPTSAYVAAQDYRRNASTGSEANYFPAATASYCAASDAVCTECLQAKGSVTHLSDYCVGKGGCVCVSICESPQWEALAQAQLPTAMVSEGESSVCAAAGVTGSGGPSSSSATLAPSRAPKKHVLAAEDRCTWYTNQTRCGLPRTCYDCLNVPIASGERCTITPSGYCASISQYDPLQDFRVNASAATAHYFPSTNTSYCEASDAVCSRCRATNFQAARDGRVNPPQFCVGDGGCVCVGFCESPLWRSSVASSLCQDPTLLVGTTESSLSLASPLRTVVFITMTVVGVAVALVVLLSCRGALMLSVHETVGGSTYPQTCY
ncbi:hypothetical protein PybrP1_007563 [[Pythium] brassicae (nom. inval.)]|nr:hypothetical protein PybrP1_007563 [[Pythium] brassicae (nom. inval.)]